MQTKIILIILIKIYADRQIMHMRIHPYWYTYSVLQTNHASPNTKLHSQFPALSIRHSHTLLPWIQCWQGRLALAWQSLTVIVYERMQVCVRVCARVCAWVRERVCVVCVCACVCACSGMCSRVGCRDISNNIAIWILVAQHVAMLSGWNDGPIHPSVVRATRPTVQQNRISRSYTEVCSTT